MAAPRHIPLERRGTLLLFAVNQPEEALRRLAGPAEDSDRPLIGAAPALLGVDALDLRHVELFHSRDLAGLGLPAYLATAYDIDESEIAPHRSTLETLEGPVLLLLSDALPLPATLAPQGALTLLAEMRTPEAPVSATRLSATATAPRPAAPATAPRAPQGRRPTGFILLALLLAAALIWVGGSLLTSLGLL